MFLTAHPEGWRVQALRNPGNRRDRFSGQGKVPTPASQRSLARKDERENMSPFPSPRWILDDLFRRNERGGGFFMQRTSSRGPARLLSEDRLVALTAAFLDGFWISSIRPLGD